MKKNYHFLLLSYFIFLPILGFSQASDCTNAIWPIPASSVLTPSATCVNSAFSLTASFSGAVASCVGATHPTCGWFSFIATCSSSKITISGGTKKTAIVIWNDDCLFGPSEIACSNSNNTTPSLTFSTIPGTQYLIQLVRTEVIGGAATGNICVTNAMGAITNNGSCTSITNSDLEGCAGISVAPIGWTTVAVGDPACLATNPPSATPDLVDASSPSLSDFRATPQSGLVCVAGLHCGVAPNLYHEGIKQSISGFTIGSTYTITFYQSVIKQASAADPTGCWTVYADNLLIGTSAISTSLLAVGNTNVTWEQRTVSFTATATTHVMKFMPKDNDASLTSFGVGEAAGVRMGLDNISLNCPMPLPVELLDFGATRKGKNVEIYWTVATESKNDYFVIERSSDGLEWNDVAKVDGEGNASSTHRYGYKDENLFFQTTYYKLKQVDFNGDISYSETVSVEKMDRNNWIKIFPNPTSDDLNIVSNGESLMNSTIKIIDLRGKTVFKINIMEDINQTLLNTNDISDGIYFVEIISPEINAREILLKKH